MAYDIYNPAPLATPLPWEDTAWHEAGHVVALHAMGFAVAVVGIERNGNGSTRPADYVGEPPMKGMDRAVFAAAGVAATARRYPDKPNPTTYSPSDLKWIEIGLWQHAQAQPDTFDGDFDALARQAVARADAILAQHWSKVDQIANRLLTHGWVTGRHLADILTPTPKPEGGRGGQISGAFSPPTACNSLTRARTDFE